MPPNNKFSLDFTLRRGVRVPSAICRESDMRSLAEFVFDAEKVSGPVELSLDLISPERIQELNRRFRGVDRETDVISFRQDLSITPTREAARRAKRLEGDIAINVSLADRQARQAGHSIQREIRYLWIHGLLHLLGYSDYEPRPRKIMFQRQDHLLRQYELSR